MSLESPIKATSCAGIGGTIGWVYEHEYQHGMVQDPETGLWYYEYSSLTAGCCRIGGMSDIEALNLADELDAAEAAGEDWESVIVRWAQGYRDDKP